VLAIAIGRASDELDLVQPIGGGGAGREAGEGSTGRLYRGGSRGGKRENGEPTERQAVPNLPA
jgi:hypothetical protein